MRVAYRRGHAGPDDHIPDFLRSEFKSGAWERTGFDVDFPAIAMEPAVAAAIGYTGRNFVGDAMDIRRWYDRDANVMAGSVVFSSGCEGPPDHVHGGAVSTALDDVLGTMAWREVGFPRWGLPTMQLTVRFLAGAPMERQLRFDTRVVKREGRKVFVEAALRDPTCGNKLLAEGEGLFYLRKRPSSSQTQQQSPPTTRPPPTSDVRTTTGSAIRGAAASDAAAKPSHGRLAPSSAERGAEKSQLPLPLPPPPPTPSPSVSSNEVSASASRSPPPPQQQQQQQQSSSSSTTTTPKELLTYDEAVRQFGAGNPNAAANLVAFYGGAGGGDPTATATANATATATATANATVTATANATAIATANATAIATANALRRRQQRSRL